MVWAWLKFFDLITADHAEVTGGDYAIAESRKGDRYIVVIQDDF